MVFIALYYECLMLRCGDAQQHKPFYIMCTPSLSHVHTIPLIPTSCAHHHSHMCIPSLAPYQVLSLVDPMNVF